MEFISKLKLGFLLVVVVLTTSLQTNTTANYKFAVLKYNGGGDWYANPTSVPNLVKFCNKELKTNISKTVDEVHVSSADIFKYPFIHMTGHGNVVWNTQEVENIRKYLIAGGFLHIDDNYGMDKYVRPQIKKIFPEHKLVEIPFTHAIFKNKYKFPNGLPKIHEHDNKAPQAFGIIHGGKLVLLYTYECDLGDGWEDPEVHKDSQEKRVKALQMGANIVKYALNLD